MSAEPGPTEATATTIGEGGAVNLDGIDWAAVGSLPTPDQAVYAALEEPFAEYDNYVENATRENDKRLNAAIGAVEDRLNGVETHVDTLQEDHDTLRGEFDAHNHDSRYPRKYEVYTRTASDDRFVNEEDGWLRVYSGKYLDGGGRIDLQDGRTLEVDYDYLRGDLEDDLDTGGYTGPEYVGVTAGTFLEGGGRISFGGSKSLAVNIDALTNTLDDRYIRGFEVDDVYVNTNKPDSIETMEGPLATTEVYMQNASEGLAILGDSYYWGNIETDANVFRAVDFNDNSDVGFVFERFVPEGDNVPENWTLDNDGDRHELLSVREPDMPDNFHYAGHEIIHEGNIDDYI